MLKEEFITKSIEKHGNKYDYSHVLYVNNKTKVCIICPQHGKFYQRPDKHLKGQGCPKCANKNVTSEEFIMKAKAIHGNKYDYSKVDYKNNSTKVCIICPQHGEFWQKPKNHLKGSGCYLCGVIKNKEDKTLSTEEFINKAREKHHNTYSYEKVTYQNTLQKVCIVCPKHGEFWQTPNAHLQGQGCPKCSINKNTSTTQKFIEKANHIHNNKYDYSKVDYKNNFTKVCIICPQHGEFWQRPYDHLQKHGCHKCGGTLKTTQEEFILNANKKHFNKYNYSKVKYVNDATKVCIVCPKHGEFWQTPNSHLHGQGCPKCNSSKLEHDIRLLLKDNNIKFEEQKRFDWLGRQSLDFYLPQYHIAIECQGIQHFEAKDFFGGEKGLQLIKEKDKNKLDLCKEKKINLIYYSNLKINYPYIVYEDKNEILKEINNMKSP